MIAEIIGALASIALILFALATKPTHATCDPGWFVERVYPGGIYSCARTMNGDLPAWMRPDGHRAGWIYCTGGSRAIIRLDGVTVGCSR